MPDMLTERRNSRRFPRRFSTSGRTTHLQPSRNDPLLGALPHLRFSLCTVSAECGPLLASGPALTRISTPEGASSKLCFGGVFDVRSSLPFAPCRSETHPFFNSAKCESCDEQPRPRIGKEQTGNMLDCSPNRTEAGPSAAPDRRLTPYSAIFCAQVLAAQDFTHIPAISRERNSMKIRILDIVQEKNNMHIPDGWIPKQSGSQNNKDRRHDGSALMFLIADRDRKSVV